MWALINLAENCISTMWSILMNKCACWGRVNSKATGTLVGFLTEEKWPGVSRDGIRLLRFKLNNICRINLEGKTISFSEKKKTQKHNCLWDKHEEKWRVFSQVLWRKKRHSPKWKPASLKGRKVAQGTCQIASCREEKQCWQCLPLVTHFPPRRQNRDWQQPGRDRQLLAGSQIWN